MKRRLKRSEVNHLRLLLAWVACSIGQSPDELVETVRRIAPSIGEAELTDEAKQRLVEWHAKSENVPKYVRHAVKMLRKAIADDYDVIDSTVADKPNAIEQGRRLLANPENAEVA